MNTSALPGAPTINSAPGLGCTSPIASALPKPEPAGPDSEAPACAEVPLQPKNFTESVAGSPTTKNVPSLSQASAWPKRGEPPSEESAWYPLGLGTCTPTFPTD